MDRGVLCLVMCLVAFTPLFIIPEIMTNNTTQDTKVLFAMFTAWTAAGLIALRVLAFPNASGAGGDGVRAAALAFGLASLVSCLLSSRIGYSLRACMNQWPLIIIFTAFPVIAKGKKDPGKVRVAILSAGVFVAVYGLCQYFGYDFLRRWFPFAFKDTEARNMILSTMGNPEYLGSYLGPLILLCLPDIVEGGAIRRGLASLSSAIFLLTILLSGTRGAILGIAAAAVIPAIYYIRKGRPETRRALLPAAISAIIFLGAVAVIFSFPNPLNPKGHDIAGRFASLFNIRSDSVRERILFHTLGAGMIAEKPVFGSGSGTFPLRFYPALARLAEKDEHAGVEGFIGDLQNRVADHAHNDYLEIWIENGTIGFMLFTLFLALFLSSTIGALFRDGGEPGDKALLLGLLSAALALLVNAMFSFPLHMPTRSALAWVLMGAAYTSALHLKRGDRKA